MTFTEPSVDSRPYLVMASDDTEVNKTRKRKNVIELDEELAPNRKAAKLDMDEHVQDLDQVDVPKETPKKDAKPVREMKRMGRERVRLKSDQLLAGSLLLLILLPNVPHS